MLHSQMYDPKTLGLVIRCWLSQAGEPDNFRKRLMLPAQSFIIDQDAAPENYIDIARVGIEGFSFNARWKAILKTQPDHILENVELLYELFYRPFDDRRQPFGKDFVNDELKVLVRSLARIHRQNPTAYDSPDGEAWILGFYTFWILEWVLSYTSCVKLTGFVSWTLEVIPQGLSLLTDLIIGTPLIILIAARLRNLPKPRVEHADPCVYLLNRIQHYLACSCNEEKYCRYRAESRLVRNRRFEGVLANALRPVATPTLLALEQAPPIDIHHKRWDMLIRHLSLPMTEDGYRKMCQQYRVCSFVMCSPRLNFGRRPEKKRRCSRCEVVFYCDRQCQKGRVIDLDSSLVN